MSTVILIFFIHHLQKREYLVLSNMYYSIFHFQIKSNPQFKIPLLEENAVMRSSLCGVPLLPISHKRRRPQHAPEQTYRRISLRRSMLRSFLCPIQLGTPQGYIASQETIYIAKQVTTYFLIQGINLRNSPPTSST